MSLEKKNTTRKFGKTDLEGAQRRGHMKMGTGIGATGPLPGARVSRFQPPDSKRIDCCCSQPLSCGPLSQHPWETNTQSDHQPVYTQTCPSHATTLSLTCLHPGPLDYGCVSDADKDITYRTVTRTSAVEAVSSPQCDRHGGQGASLSFSAQGQWYLPFMR